VLKFLKKKENDDMLASLIPKLIYHFLCSLYS